MERITQFVPAYDKRNPNPSKDYGIGAVKVNMVLKGELGAVHFIFSTGMLLESTMEEYIRTGRVNYEAHDWGVYYLNKPMGYGVGYHSPLPLYEGQEVRHPTKMKEKRELTETEKADSKTYLDNIEFEKIGETPPPCEWLDGKPCYCDGSALRSEEYLKVLLTEGSDKIWSMLEEDYKYHFKELK